MRDDRTRAKDRSLGCQRLLELLPGLSTYFILTSLIWGSLVVPQLFALALVAYVLYWLYRSCSLGIRTVTAYRKLRRWEAIDWLKRASKLDGFELVHHLLVIPTYRESEDVLRETLRRVVGQDFPHERIAVVLGFEARDPDARQRARLLLQEFEGQFGFLWASFHPEMPGEVAGKSSNQAWAARFAKRLLIDDAHVPLHFATVTSCDADSRLPEKYLSALTYQFLRKPRERLYQPAILFYANIWRIPAPSRVLNALHSVWQLGKLTRPDKLTPQSTYSMSLEKCVEAGYWDADVIPEDSHMFFKLLFRFGREVKVEPIYLPVIGDAAESNTYIGTLKSQFNQEQRWAWGVAEIPYVLRGLANTALPGTGSRWYRSSRYIEEHLNWPIGPFLLTFGGNAPRFFNSDFAASHLGHMLPNLIGYLMSTGLVFMVCLGVVDWKLRPQLGSPRSLAGRVRAMGEWVLLPAVGLALSALPGVLAHTRLLLGRYLEYRVTEKMSPVLETPAAGLEPGYSPVVVER